MIRFSLRGISVVVSERLLQDGGDVRELLASETHLWTLCVPRDGRRQRCRAGVAARVIYRKLSAARTVKRGAGLERMLSVGDCRQQDINVLGYLTRCYQAHLTVGRPFMLPPPHPLSCLMSYGQPAHAMKPTWP